MLTGIDKYFFGFIVLASDRNMPEVPKQVEVERDLRLGRLWNLQRILTEVLSFGQSHLSC